MEKQTEKTSAKSTKEITTKVVNSKAITTDFSKSKERYSGLHKFLISKGILDGSSDDLILDIVDGVKPGQAVDEIMNRMGKLNYAEIIEKLAYLAIGGVLKIAINLRIRHIIKDHRSEVRKAIDSKDLTVLKSLVFEPQLFAEEQLVKVARSRLKAINEVLALRGDHFLKRAKFVSPGFRVKV
jgi:hypothetical protein